jgi:spoIIIJ-associated protein
MEWVETTARTVEEAKDLALDQLGVAEDDAEIVIVDEPKAGLFGRLRGEARVRVRVRPTLARPKVENRDRRGRAKAKNGREDADGDQQSTGAAADSPVAAVAVAAAASSSSASPGVTSPGESEPARQRKPRAKAPASRPPSTSSSPSASSTATSASTSSDKEHVVSAAAVGEQARQFVDDLVAAFGLRGETSLLEDGDDLEVQVDGDDLGLLVGPRGATLLAVQDLARVASQRRLGDHSTRLRVDIGGYRVRRREALTRFAAQVSEEVIRTGTARALEPMPSSDRKVIHEALLEVDGVSTRSEGDDPNRRVIVDPASPTD